MKKKLPVIILSAIVFFLLLVIALLCLIKDPWQGRFYSLLGDYNRLIDTNAKMTEELTLLKQKQETLNNVKESTVIEKTASSSTKF